LVITFSGAADPGRAAAVEQELKEALERLRAPIDVLSDIRELQSLEGVAADDFRRITDHLRRFGVKKVVRVVGKSAQAAVHMQRLSRQLQGHTAHLAFSMEEAEAVFSK
jgi:plasmid stabilization system protein ParE